MSIKRVLNRTKFHLLGLVLIAPLVLAPAHLSGESDDDGIKIGERQIGPWTAELSQNASGGPRPFYGLFAKDYTIEFCKGCGSKIRGAYLSVGKDPTLPAEGAIVHGHGDHQHAHVPFPRTLKGGEKLWLVAESWDGTVHRTAWEMHEAVPDVRLASSQEPASSPR